jgi:tetratricopeptide (TPR) repeat protein
MKEEQHSQIQEYIDTAKAAFERGAYSEAEMKLCLAVREAEALASDDSCMLGNCRRELAMALRRQGEHKPALDQLERAIEAFDKRFGPDNIGTASCLLLEGDIYDHELKKYALAEPQLKRAISIFEKVQDACAGDSSVAQDLLGLNLDAHIILGNNLRKQLRNTEAEVWLRLGLTMAERSPGQEHRRNIIILSLSGLARVILGSARMKASGGLTGRNDTTGAAPLFESGIQILESTEEPGHDDILAALEDLAQYHASSGRHDESAQARRRALAHADQRFGEDSTAIVGHLKLLAESYELSGKYREATALRQRLLNIQESKLGQTHPDVGSALVDLAIAYDLEGKHQAADPFYARYFAVTPVEEIERFIYQLEKAGATVADLPGYRSLEMAAWIRQRLGDITDHVTRDP